MPDPSIPTDPDGPVQVQWLSTPPVRVLRGSISPETLHQLPSRLEAEHVRLPTISVLPILGVVRRSSSTKTLRPSKPNPFIASAPTSPTLSSASGRAHNVSHGSQRTNSLPPRHRSPSPMYEAYAAISTPRTAYLARQAAAAPAGTTSVSLPTTTAPTTTAITTTSSSSSTSNTSQRSPSPAARTYQPDIGPLATVGSSPPATERLDARVRDSSSRRRSPSSSARTNLYQWYAAPPRSRSRTPSGRVEIKSDVRPRSTSPGDESPRLPRAISNRSHSLPPRQTSVSPTAAVLQREQEVSIHTPISPEDMHTDVLSPVSLHISASDSFTSVPRTGVLRDPRKHEDISRQQTPEIEISPVVIPDHHVPPALNRLKSSPLRYTSIPDSFSTHSVQSPSSVSPVRVPSLYSPAFSQLRSCRASSTSTNSDTSTLPNSQSKSHQRSVSGSSWVPTYRTQEHGDSSSSCAPRRSSDSSAISPGRPRILRESGGSKASLSSASVKDHKSGKIFAHASIPLDLKPSEQLPDGVTMHVATSPPARSSSLSSRRGEPPPQPLLYSRPVVVSVAVPTRTYSRSRSAPPRPISPSVLPQTSTHAVDSLPDQRASPLLSKSDSEPTVILRPTDIPRASSSSTRNNATSTSTGAPPMILAPSVGSSSAPEHTSSLARGYSPVACASSSPAFSFSAAFPSTASSEVYSPSTQSFSAPSSASASFASSVSSAESSSNFVPRKGSVKELAAAFFAASNSLFNNPSTTDTRATTTSATTRIPKEITTTTNAISPTTMHTTSTTTTTSVTIPTTSHSTSATVGAATTSPIVLRPTPITATTILHPSQPTIATTMSTGSPPTLIATLKPISHTYDPSSSSSSTFTSSDFEAASTNTNTLFLNDTSPPLTRPKAIAASRSEHTIKSGLDGTPPHEVLPSQLYAIRVSPPSGLSSPAVSFPPAGSSPKHFPHALADRDFSLPRFSDTDESPPKPAQEPFATSVVLHKEDWEEDVFKQTVADVIGGGAQSSDVSVGSVTELKDSELKVAFEVAHVNPRQTENLTAAIASEEFQRVLGENQLPSWAKYVDNESQFLVPGRLAVILGGASLEDLAAHSQTRALEEILAEQLGVDNVSVTKVVDSSWNVEGVEGSDLGVEFQANEPLTAFHHALLQQAIDEGALNDALWQRGMGGTRATGALVVDSESANAPRRSSIVEPGQETKLTSSNNAGKRLSIDGGSGSRRGSIDLGRRGSVDPGRRASLDLGRRGSTELGRRDSVDDGKRGSVDDGRKGSVDAGSVDDGRRRSVDAGRRGSMDAGRRGSVETGLGGNVELGRAHANNGSSESRHVGTGSGDRRRSSTDSGSEGNFVGSGRREDVNDGRRGSADDDGRRGSVDARRRGSVEPGVSVEGRNKDLARGGTLDLGRRSSTEEDDCKHDNDTGRVRRTSTSEDKRNVAGGDRKDRDADSRRDIGSKKRDFVEEMILKPNVNVSSRYLEDANARAVERPERRPSAEDQVRKQQREAKLRLSSEEKAKQNLEEQLHRTEKLKEQEEKDHAQREKIQRDKDDRKKAKEKALHEREQRQQEQQERFQQETNQRATDVERRRLEDMKLGEKERQRELERRQDDHEYGHAGQSHMNYEFFDLDVEETPPQPKRTFQSKQHIVVDKIPEQQFTPDDYLYTDNQHDHETLQREKNRQNNRNEDQLLEGDEHNLTENDQLLSEYYSSSSSSSAEEEFSPLICLSCDQENVYYAKCCSECGAHLFASPDDEEQRRRAARREREEQRQQRRQHQQQHQQQHQHQQQSQPQQHQQQQPRHQPQLQQPQTQTHPYQQSLPQHQYQPLQQRQQPLPHARPYQQQWQPQYFDEQQQYATHQQPYQHPDSQYSPPQQHPQPRSRRNSMESVGTVNSRSSRRRNSVELLRRPSLDQLPKEQGKVLGKMVSRVLNFDATALTQPYSAPPPPVQRTLYVKCRNLLQMDWFSPIHPLVALFERQRDGSFRFVDQSELVMDQLDPDFQKAFVVIHRAGEDQELLFRVYEVEKAVIQERSFRCQALVNLDELVAENSPGTDVPFPLDNPSDPLLNQQFINEQTTLCVRHQAYLDPVAHRERVVISLACRSLFLPQRTAKLVAAVFLQDLTTFRHNFLDQSEVSSECVNPFWTKHFVVEGDPAQEMKISVYDTSGGGFSDADRIGSVLLRVCDLRPGDALTVALSPNESNAERSPGSMIVRCVSREHSDSRIPTDGAHHFKSAQVRLESTFLPSSAVRSAVKGDLGDDVLMQIQALITEGRSFKRYFLKEPYQYLSLFYRSYARVEKRDYDHCLFWGPEASVSNRVKELQSSRCMPLASIQSIVLGNQCAAFQEAWGNNAIPAHCFSIISATNILNLEATHANHRDAWVFSLTALLAKYFQVNGVVVPEGAYYQRGVPMSESPEERIVNSWETPYKQRPESPNRTPLQPSKGPLHVELEVSCKLPRVDEVNQNYVVMLFEKDEHLSNTEIAAFSSSPSSSSYASSDQRKKKNRVVPVDNVGFERKLECDYRKYENQYVRFAVYALGEREVNVTNENRLGSVKVLLSRLVGERDLNTHGQAFPLTGEGKYAQVFEDYKASITVRVSRTKTKQPLFSSSLRTDNQSTTSRIGRSRQR